MKKTRRTLAIIIAALMCLTLAAACGNKDDSSSNTGNTGSTGNTGTGSTSSPAGGGSQVSPPEQGTSATPPPDVTAEFVEHLRISVDNNAVRLINPFSTAGSDPGAFWTYRMIYDTLLFDPEDGSGRYEPCLATSWETNDYKTFTFKLRNDVYFHNGDHFTAKDVEYTIKTAQSEMAIGSGGATRWADVESVRIIDDYTIELTLDKVYVDFPWLISFSQAGIVNERAMREDPENGVWIGTGAFKMTGFSTMDYIDVERNDNYWGGVPYTKSMRLQFIPEMSTRTIMLQNGELDLCFALSPEDLPIFERDREHFEIYPNRYNNPNTVVWNMEDPIISDWSFRMALASAINREEVAIVAAGDYGEPVREGVIWGYATEFRDNSIPIVPYDPVVAKEYLDKSVYNGEVIEITAAIITNVRAAEVIQQQLEEIGIRTRINQMEPNTIGSYVQWDNNQSQILVFLTGMGMRAGDARRIYYPEAFWNMRNYVNQRNIEIMDLSPTVTDDNARRDLYSAVQQNVYDDLPGLNLFWLLNANVGVKGIGGLAVYPSGNFDLRWIYLPVS